MARSRSVPLLFHAGSGRDGVPAAPPTGARRGGSEPVSAARDVALQLVPAILQIHIVVAIHVRRRGAQRWGWPVAAAAPPLCSPPNQALFIALRAGIASTADLYAALCAIFSLGVAALAADGSYPGELRSSPHATPPPPHAASRHPVTSAAASLAALLSITFAASPILQSLTQVRAAPASTAARLTPRSQDFSGDTILFLSGSLGALHLLTLPPARHGRVMCVASGRPHPLHPRLTSSPPRRSALSPLPTNAAAGCVFVLSSHLGDAVLAAGFTALSLSLLLFAWPALCALARRLTGASPPEDDARPAAASAAGITCAALCVAVALVVPALAASLLALTLALLVATPLVVKALWPIREHDAPLSATYAQR